MQSKFSTLLTHTYTASLNFNSKMLDCVKTHHHWITRVYHSWSFAKACGERESCVRETFLYTSLRNSPNLNFMFLWLSEKLNTNVLDSREATRLKYVGSPLQVLLCLPLTLLHTLSLSLAHTHTDTLITCANIFLLPCVFVFARYSCSCRLLFFLNFWIFLFSSFTLRDSFPLLLSTIINPSHQ